MPKYEITFMDAACNVIGIMEREGDYVVDVLESIVDDWGEDLPFDGAVQVTVMLKEPADV